MTEKEKVKAYDNAIERTKKSYDEAIERAKKLYSNGIAEEIFPELKESDDEKIRRWIIDDIRYNMNNEPLNNSDYKKKAEKAIDWLEKQRDKDKLIQELGEYKVKYTQEVLEKYINSMSNKDDERLRKTAIAFLKDFAEQGYENAVECIDWLEKQGKNSTDKIEPKFKVSDWVVNKFGDSWHIDSLDKKNYQVSDGKGNYNYFPISKQDEMHLWTIQDARDGDVLFFYSEYKSHKMTQVGIIEKYVGKHGGCSNTFKIYVGVNWDNNLQIGKYMGCSDIHPATKEQRDLLFQKIKEAGYKWNTETKTLEKLVEPKFKVGDWVVQNYNILKIRYVGNEYYCFETVDAYVDYMLVSEIDSLYHLWTIQDAKVGDVLEFGDHGRLVIGILSGINKTTGKVDVSCL